MRRVITMLVLSLVVFPICAFTRSSGDGPLAPDFTLPTARGDVSLHDLRGKVVLVDFWASWCGPCRQSFPWMKGMAERYGQDGLVVVTINLDKKQEAADSFLDKFAHPFIVAFDPRGKTAEAFHVEAMPSSFIVNRSGKIIYAHQGFEPSKAQAVEEKLKEALR